MYQAIPYSSGTGPALCLRPSSTSPPVDDKADADAALRRTVSESPVAVVCRRGCCLTHVVRRLLISLGVNPAVCEVDDDSALETAGGAGGAALPAVFVGGRLLGGLERLLAVHISGELVPILKQAGALWL